MKIKINFGITKLVLLIAVGLLALASIIVNLLFLIGVGKLVTNVPIAAGISMGLSVLIVAFDLSIIFHSNYKFSEEELVVSISFFQDKIAYSDIIALKEESNTNAFYLVFKYSSKRVQDGKSSIRLLMKEGENQKVVDFIKEKNAAVEFEQFTDKK